MPTIEEYRKAAPFTLEQLVEAANTILHGRPEPKVSKRTVRFYIHIGLLPPPIGVPKYARYSYEHLVRLVLVRLLLGQGLRLDAIRQQLKSLAENGTEAMVKQVSRLVTGMDFPLFSAGISFMMPSAPPTRYHACKADLGVFDADEAVSAYCSLEPEEFLLHEESYSRIRLTDKVSLEISSEAELPEDLEAALEALEKILKKIRDTS